MSIRPRRLLFLTHVRLVLVVDEVNDWVPAVLVIDIVTEARGINNRQLDLEVLLLHFCAHDVDLGRAIQLLIMANTIILGSHQLGGE